MMTPFAFSTQHPYYHEKARPMLGRIYGSFNEGFDTADLIVADALFDEIGH